VGVVGFSNVGKSSLVNALVGKNLQPVSSLMFLTRQPRELILGRDMKIVDSPAIVQSQGAGIGYRQLRSALAVEEIEDLAAATEQVMAKVPKVELLRHYRIGDFQTAEELLEQVARKKGLLREEAVEQTQTLKKLVPAKKRREKAVNETVQVVVGKRQVADREEAARRVLRDFLGGRLTYFTRP
jgi:ribosome biogenesis GTPase A